MKRMLICGLLLPALALCACNSGGVLSNGSDAPPAAASSAIDKVTLDGTKALVLAEDSYQALAQQTSTLVQKGVIHGAAATKLRQLNATVTGALETGFAAQDSAARAAAAAKAIAAIGDIHALIGK